MSPEALAFASIVATAVVGLLFAWIRWSIRTAVKEVVNGKIDLLTTTVQKIDRWTLMHDTRHVGEQSALMSALARQGVDGPDGWKFHGTIEHPEHDH